MWKEKKKEVQGLNMANGWRPVEKKRRKKKNAGNWRRGKPGLVASAAGGARSEGTAGSSRNPMMTSLAADEDRAEPL